MKVEHDAPALKALATQPAEFLEADEQPITKPTTMTITNNFLIFTE